LRPAFADVVETFTQNAIDWTTQFAVFISSPMREIAISLKNVSKCFKRYTHPVDRLKEILLPGKKQGMNFGHCKTSTWRCKGTARNCGKEWFWEKYTPANCCRNFIANYGEVRVNGRVSALLEQGGFNLGRQNVF